MSFLTDFVRINTSFKFLCRTIQSSISFRCFWRGGGLILRFSDFCSRLLAVKSVFILVFCNDADLQLVCCRFLNSLKSKALAVWNTFLIYATSALVLRHKGIGERHGFSSVIQSLFLFLCEVFLKLLKHFKWNVLQFVE